MKLEIVGITYIKPLLGQSPAIDAMLIIRPPFLPLEIDIFSTAKKVPYEVPSNMTSIQGFQPCVGLTPALFTKRVT